MEYIGLIIALTGLVMLYLIGSHREAKRLKQERDYAEKINAIINHRTNGIDGVYDDRADELNGRR